MAELRKLDKLINDMKDAKDGRTHLTKVQSDQTPISANRSAIQKAMLADDPVSAIANLMQSDPATAWAYLMGDRAEDIELPARNR